MAAGAMTAAIETNGLRKQFGEKVAVEDLSLTVPRGEVFGFLGPNGAGKTTSLKMLLGLVEATAGSATVLGAPLGDRATRARMGFLPEHFRFQDWLTGRELLRFHGRLYGTGRRRARSARRRAAHARGSARRRASRGQDLLQGHDATIGLAQALLAKPELVFLDEPTSGLDPLGRLLVRDIIHELKADGTTVFLNSHLLGEVEATCDRVVFVKAGRAVHELSLSGDVAGLDVELKTGPLDDGACAALAELGAVQPGLDGCVRMRVAALDVLPEIARRLVARGVALYEMKAARKSLEAWFLEVMGEEQRPG
jgi:ABC-2 type transport system ATP-binding protein